MPGAQRVWIIVLSAKTRHQLRDGADYIPSLVGMRCLITDLDFLSTITVLADTGLLGMFHHIVDRGRLRASDPTFLANTGRVLGITRRQRCVYFDANPGAVVAAQLQGWCGCLLAEESALAHPEYKKHRSGNHRAGVGVWYDARFAHLRTAFRHFLFGRSSKSRR